jgi:hypothetical protein
VSKHVGAAEQNNKLLKLVHLLVIYKYSISILCLLIDGLVLVVPNTGHPLPLLFVRVGTHEKSDAPETHKNEIHL